MNYERIIYHFIISIKSLSYSYNKVRHRYYQLLRQILNFEEMSVLENKLFILYDIEKYNSKEDMNEKYKHKLKHPPKENALYDYKNHANSLRRINKYLRKSNRILIDRYWKLHNLIIKNSETDIEKIKYMIFHNK